METSQLKSYAPGARTDFIKAVTDRAAAYGLTAEKIEPIVEEGDVAIIADVASPSYVGAQRRRLEERVERDGFHQTMEAIAYTWFNRFIAIRFMELHGYLDHGYRVLSHPEGLGRPEILEHVDEVDLPGLDRDRAIELKLDGAKDEELYRLVLLAQCNALHEAMPFLFEKIGDETELLLPANLLHTDSLIRKLVEEIDEVLWQDIEIIGWLYQFYISEKKDEVIGKVVKSEDIPAATQLFTPNWIVKYMVQNSLGAQWLATYPDSPLKGQMEYYIQPAEQTDEVKAQLAAITPDTLNPEEMTLIDPACGSGHILVEAYDLFKAIYLERGYRQRDLPKLIFEKNLFGLEICPRAAQLTGFALMMKGRADDRRLFERGVRLNVMALQDSTEFDAEALAKGVALSEYGVNPGDLKELKRLFEHATTFGALIQVPDELAEKLPGLTQLIEATSQDLFVSKALKRLRPLVQQAELLAAQYDAVVANPPYMGGKFMNALIKQFAKDYFPDAKSDLFTCFIERDLTFSKPRGRLGFMSPFVWMFISSHEDLRTRLIESETITSLIQLEYSGFEGATVPICTFTLQNSHVNGQRGSFIRLSDFRGADNQGPKTLEAISDPSCGWFFEAVQDDFKKIPGSPIAYWVSEAVTDIFEREAPLGDVLDARPGLQTSDNARFLRLWSEVDLGRIGFGAESRTASKETGRKWFPCNKGGQYRKWYGNIEHVVNWENDGEELYAFASSLYGSPTRIIKNAAYYFRESVTWSDITSGRASFRFAPRGCVFDATGHSAFNEQRDILFAYLAYLNTDFVNSISKVINPTFHFHVGYFRLLPSISQNVERHSQIAERAVHQGQTDWNAHERSWDFQSLPLLTDSSEPTPSLESSYAAWITQNRDTIAEMKRLEEENNHLFIDAYGLADELPPDVPIEQITLTVNPAYRYGGKLSEEEQWTRFREDTMQELVSYALGCMMGRYSLDAPGLVYAHSGNEGFDAGKYTTFPADDDGIVPLTDTEWFDDDACNRLVEFMSVAWDESNLEENLSFLAANLSPKKNESSRDTIRRYLCDGFFKEHLQTYKKRPIYWLFSSGKQKAFQCLVYLHRYNEGTLARMRTEYVVPLQGRMASRVDQLEGDISAASSTSHRRKLEKERERLVKQQAELREFDEKLRHYADQRIALDLDDGVKVNYGKFGDLLAEVKAVTGKKAN